MKLCFQSPALMRHAGNAAEEEERWRRWVDARLVRVLTINIYRNRAESFQTFDYITQQGNFSWAEREFGRVFGAATMWWAPPAGSPAVSPISTAAGLPPPRAGVVSGPGGTYRSSRLCSNCRGEPGRLPDPIRRFQWAAHQAVPVGCQ